MYNKTLGCRKNLGMQKSLGMMIFWLVVSTHLKNIRQNGNLPLVGVKMKNI